MDVFKLVGSIFIKNEEANDEIDQTTDKAEQASGKLGKAFGTIAKGVGIAVTAGATAVSFLTKGAIEAYADYEQLTGGVETLFGTSADKVTEYANKAYQTAGLSANEYMETVTSFSASLLQSLGGDTEKATESANLAITDMADNANKMGTSMESIQNAYQGFAKQNYTMLDNLKLGYGGTKEEMERLLADAEKLSGQKFDLSSYADIVDAIHVVQTEMGITGTTALEASTTISGSLASMKSAWSNVLVAMGNDGADFNAVITQLVDSAMTVVSNILPRIQIIFQAIPTLVNQLSAQIPAIVSAILPSLLQGTMSLLNGLVSALPSLMGILMKMLPILIDGVLQLTVGIVSNIADIIEPIITALPDIFMMLVEGILTNVPALIQGCVELIVMLVNATPEIIASLIENIPTIIKMVIQALWQSFPDILTVVKSMLGSITAVISGVFEGIKRIVSDAFSAIKNKAVEIWGQVKTAITTPIENARDKVKEVIEKIKSFFKFDWSLPKLKMPHVTISGKFSLSPPSVPKFSIDWYKKAMDDPMLFTKPTLFDVNPLTGSVKGAGEAGDEVMIGKQTMLNMIQNAVSQETSSAMNNMNGILNSILDLLSDYIPDLSNTQLVLDTGAVVGGLAPAMNNQLGAIYRKKQRGV